VKGRYGIGKTELLARYASDNSCVYVRAKETWTKRALLDELADALGLDKRGRNQEVQQRIIIKLGTTGVTVIVDEADFLIRTTPSLLEVLRDITDSTQITCFLIGMEQFPMRVARYGHIASRVASIVEFQPLSLEDVTATVKAKAEIQIESEVLPEILRQSEGRMRFVLNAVSKIEDLAETNGWARVKVEHI
ncbi:AAA family ATPase, partial [Leptospira sp. SA-E8]|uniref:AAA family ATPase n=1 Tax=Leptospira sp. SA-E8 TaxID=3422259 RepID=UPI003EB996C6